MKGKIALVTGILTIVCGVLCWLIPNGIGIFLPAASVLWFIGAITGNIAWGKDRQIEGKRGFITSMVGWVIALGAYLYHYSYLANV